MISIIRDVYVFVDLDEVIQLYAYFRLFRIINKYHTTISRSNGSLATFTIK